MDSLGRLCLLAAVLASIACGRKDPAAGRAHAPSAAPNDEGRAAFEGLREAVARADVAAFLACLPAEDRGKMAAGFEREIELLRGDPFAMANFRRETGSDLDPEAMPKEDFARLRLEQMLRNPRRRAYLDEWIGAAYVRSSRIGDLLRIEAKGRLGDPATTAWVREEGRWRLSRTASLDASNRVIARFEPPGGAAENLAFSPDGRRIAAQSRDKTLRVWDIDPPSGPRTLGAIDGHALDIAWLSDGTIAVVTVEGKLLVYPEGGGEPRVVDVGEFWVKIARAGCFAVKRGSGEAIEIREVATGNTRGFVVLGRDLARSFALSPDGSRLAVSSGYCVSLHDVATGNRVSNLPGVREWLWLDFSPDGRFLGAAEKGGHVRLWECATGLEVGKVRLAGEEDQRPFVLLDGPRVARADGFDIRFAVADSSRGRSAKLGLPIVALVASADGLRVAASFKDGGFVVLDATE